MFVSIIRAHSFNFVGYFVNVSKLGRRMPGGNLHTNGQAKKDKFVLRPEYT